jgi:pyruvate kinase
MLALRNEVATTALSIASTIGPAAATDAAIANLVDYLALRRHDLRALQRRLMPLGLSSLGRLESRVLPTLDAVIGCLSVLAGQETRIAAPTPEAFFAGETRLIEGTSALFGAPRRNRQTRIMVTLPSEAAWRPDFIRDLARAGMDVARINCAHDDPEAWRAMAGHVRMVAKGFGMDLKVLMDIAGPKIRTAAVALPEPKARLHAGDRVRLVATGIPRPCPAVPCSAGVSLPEIVTRLKPGDRLRYDDGKLEATVESVSDGEAVILVNRTKANGTKLKPEKGINLPDTALGLSPLTAKDRTDLATVIECADMVGYSFVSRPRTSTCSMPPSSTAAPSRPASV